MNTPTTWDRRTAAAGAMLAAALLLSGCMVGPDFKPPPVQMAENWVEAPPDQVRSDTQVLSHWWKTFNDPVLDKLVEMAYSQNLTLRVAGLRVLEARAQRGIDVGNFFPQVQQASGGIAHIGTSQNTVGAAPPRYFDSTVAAIDVSWELDVWGKFRRGIESSNAALYSSVMNYDDALVTLVADVATTYITLRGIDERIQLAIQNVAVQQGALDIANVRFNAGGTSELDVTQAKSQLADTQALIPFLQQARRQNENQLCTLLGIPPTDLSDILGKEIKPIPTPPQTIAVGIPAQLLRRRPDIRRAEADAAAQCAQIGVATSDLYPHFYLAGSIGFSAENPSDLFKSTSLAYAVGPSFKWDILNYGRIMNNIRVQDARFEQLITQYQNTVLTAQQDVANAITSLIYSREQEKSLNDSVAASLRSVDISMLQYKAGGADYLRVLIANQFLVQEQDKLVVSRINVATSAIALNKALGGGWEIRANNEFVPPETIQRMRARTNWGKITDDNYSSKKDFYLFPRPQADNPPTTRPSHD